MFEWIGSIDYGNGWELYFRAEGEDVRVAKRSYVQQLGEKLY
jgi:hypothetical protein